jgi:hypothetical protein
MAQGSPYWSFYENPPKFYFGYCVRHLNAVIFHLQAWPADEKLWILGAFYAIIGKHGDYSWRLLRFSKKQENNPKKSLIPIKAI